MTKKRQRGEEGGVDTRTEPSVDHLSLYVQRWRSRLANPTHHHDEVLSNAKGGPQPNRAPQRNSINASSSSLLASSRRIAGQQASVGGTAGTAFVYHPDTLLHRNDLAREVERPERVSRSMDHLKALGLLELCVPMTCKKATTRQLARVHSDRHIDTVDQWGIAVEVSGTQSASVGCDLYACKDTSRAARLAAGGVVEAALAVCRGEVDNAFAMIRPPGHHCSSTHPGGFCFFNNVAVAVRAAQRELMAQRGERKDDDENDVEEGRPLPRILIVDWDVHHCDGTEEVFYDDPSVVVFSMHQHGSLPKHTLRRPHRQQPAAETAMSSPTSPSSVPVPVRETENADIGADELQALLGEDEEDWASGEKAADVDEALVDTKLPPSTAAVPDPAAETTTRSARQRPPVDFKTLAKELDATDQSADNFFKSAGLLTEGDVSENGGNAGSDSFTASREGDDDSTWDDDSEDLSETPAAVQPLNGDSDGISSTAEEVDERELFYPGTGHIDKIGNVEAGAGGTNINFAWPTTGFGDLEYLMALNSMLPHLVEEFQPEMVFISCGFDCADGDLLGSMRLTPSGFRMMTKLVLSLCPKVVVALEGGYNLSQVAMCSEAVVRELLLGSHRNDPTFRLPPSTMLIDRLSYVIDTVKATHGAFWRGFNQKEELTL